MQYRFRLLSVLFTLLSIVVVGCKTTDKSSGVYSLAGPLGGCAESGKCDSARCVIERAGQLRRIGANGGGLAVAAGITEGGMHANRLNPPVETVFNTYALTTAEGEFSWKSPESQRTLTSQNNNAIRALGSNPANRAELRSVELVQNIQGQQTEAIESISRLSLQEGANQSALVRAGLLDQASLAVAKAAAMAEAGNPRGAGAMFGAAMEFLAAAQMHGGGNITQTPFYNETVAEVKRAISAAAGSAEQVLSGLRLPLAKLAATEAAIASGTTANQFLVEVNGGSQPAAQAAVQLAVTQELAAELAVRTLETAGRISTNSGIRSAPNWQSLVRSPNFNLLPQNNGLANQVAELGRVVAASQTEIRFDVNSLNTAMNTALQRMSTSVPAERLTALRSAVTPEATRVGFERAMAARNPGASVQVRIGR